MQKPCGRGWWPPIFIRLLFITYQPTHYKTKKGAQWLNGRVLGSQVRAPPASLCCVLEQTNNQYKTNRSRSEKMIRACLPFILVNQIISFSWIDKISKVNPTPLYIWTPFPEILDPLLCWAPSEGSGQHWPCLLADILVLSYAHRTPNEDWLNCAKC